MPPRRFTHAVAALVAALAVALAGGCTNSAAVSGHHLRIADGGDDLSTLNPHLTMGATMDFVAHLSMGYFIRYDPQARPIPDLVTVIPSRDNGGVSADGRRVTWHLRHGVRWSDGQPFDAADVAFTIRTIRNPANNEVQGSTGWDEISAVDTPDPYTVVYHLKRAYGAIIPLSFATVGAEPCLLPRHLLAGLPTINHAAYNRLPVGLGPFRIVRWNRGQSVEMEANPYYWGGRPKLERVTFAFLSSRETLLVQMRSGDIDLWPLVPPTYMPQLAHVAGIRVTDAPTLRTTHLDFLLTPGSLGADLAVRRAVRWAIDRRHIIDTVEHGAGYVTDSIVWPYHTVTADDPSAVTPDPARARAELTAAGWLPGPDGIRVKAGRRLALVVPYQSGAADFDGIIELLRVELRAVGIEIDTRTYSHTVLFAPLGDGGIIAGGKFDMVLYASTITTVPDFASNFDCTQIPPHGENYVHWCDNHVMSLLDDMRRAYGDAQIKRAYAGIDERFRTQIPSIQLFVWRGGYAESDRLSGYEPNVLSSFDQMRDIDMK